MEVQFLLIGHGLTGKIKSHEYPCNKLRITEVTVESANNHSVGAPVKTFDVIQHMHNGEFYAIAVGASTNSIQIESLIDSTKLKPIPKHLLT